MKAEQHEVSFSDEQLRDLRDRLARTRWSPEVANDDWAYGTSGRYLRSLVEYWLDGFDWRKQEEAINAFSHFRVTLDDIPVHFIHARGKGPNPTPVILTHGWPWTFWDWHRVIPRLTDPVAYGGRPEDSFDVIVPSLPGYTLSTPLTKTGVTVPVIASLWDRLMRDVLGYDRYGAVGGDWGSLVTTELGMHYLDSVLGIYLSLGPLFHAGGMEALRPEDYSPEEAGWYERSQRKWATSVPCHVTVHSTDPQTLAWALNDSPVGLASWVLERRHNWCGGSYFGPSSERTAAFEKLFSRDFLLTTVCLYWLTESIGPSMRLYADSFPSGLRLPIQPAKGVLLDVPPPPRIEAPTGIGVFPGEVTLIPRKICEDVSNLVHWSVLPEGGHFSPAEQPDIYARDVETFFRGLKP